MTTRAERAADLNRRAREAYAKHSVVTECGPGHWIIKRGEGPSFVMWTRIIAATPHLIVVGDGPSAIFYGNPGAEPLGMVRWVAGGGDSYMSEKLSSGMRGPESLGSQRDAKIMAADIREHMADSEGSDREAWTRALYQVEGEEDIEGAARTVGGGVTDGWEYGVGSCASSRIFYAREACRTLLRLLADTPKPTPEGP